MFNEVLERLEDRLFWEVLRGLGKLGNGGSVEGLAEGFCCVLALRVGDDEIGWGLNETFQLGIMEVYAS